MLVNVYLQKKKHGKSLTTCPFCKKITQKNPNLKPPNIAPLSKMHCQILQLEKQLQKQPLYADISYISLNFVFLIQHIFFVQSVVKCL